jgi:hypothetical protein
MGESQFDGIRVEGQHGIEPHRGGLDNILSSDGVPTGITPPIEKPL